MPSGIFHRLPQMLHYMHILGKAEECKGFELKVASCKKTETEREGFGDQPVVWNYETLRDINIFIVFRLVETFGVGVAIGISSTVTL